MYVATGLGATTRRCLSDAQAREAARLCNCKKYGWPEGPVKGFGQVDISLNLEASGDENPCDPKPRVKMPSDFDPKDPCEASSRLTCRQQQARELQEAVERQAAKREKQKKEEASRYEEEIVAKAALRKKLLVGGVLTAVLVGAGLVVYRSTRKG